MSGRDPKGLSRRQVLAAGAMGVAAAALDLGPLTKDAVASPTDAVAASTDAAQLAVRTTGTTLAGTVRAPDVLLGRYGKVVAGPPEPHKVLPELALTGAPAVSRPLIAFAHMSDLHIIDDKSPTRLEELDNYVDDGYVFGSAYRPHEMLSAHMTDAAVRAVANVEFGPATGLQLRLALITGDSADNCQLNETSLYIGLLDGSIVTPRSGGTAEEDVSGDGLKWGDDVITPGARFWRAHFWHPEGAEDPFNPGTVDAYRRAGFPVVPGMLAAARRQFQAHGLGIIPWYAAFGNHDRNIQGNLGQDKIYAGNLAKDHAIGDRKILTSRDPLNTPAPANGQPDTVDMFSYLWDRVESAPVTLDYSRRILSRQEWINQHFSTTSHPQGHGFTLNVDQAYYAIPYGDADLVRFICLDTTKNDSSSGEISAAQMTWLEGQLRASSSRYFTLDWHTQTQPGVPDKLIVVYGHHNIDSIDNGSQLKTLLLRYPNVIMFVNGHTHSNNIWARSRPSIAGTGGFWEINTASHIDWPIQSRIIEVAEGDGILSIFTTMVDIDAPLDFAGDVSNPRSLAALGRELAANDLQEHMRRDGVDTRSGIARDRNTQLLLPMPFKLPANPVRVAIARDRFGYNNLFMLNESGRSFGTRELGELGDTWSVGSGGQRYLQLDGLFSSLAAESNSADGSIEFVGLQPDSVIIDRRGNSTASLDPIWSNALVIDGRLTSVSLAHNVSGTVDLFGTNQQGNVWTRRRANGVWSGWTQLDGSMQTVAAEADGQGNIWLFGIGNDGRVYQRNQQTPGGALTAWTLALGNFFLRSIAVTTQADGRLLLVGSDHLGRLWWAQQTAVGSTSWHGPVGLDSLQVGYAHSVAAERGYGGRIHIAAINNANRVFSRKQITANSNDGWGVWSILPPLVAETFAVPNVKFMTTYDADNYLRTHTGYFHLGNQTPFKVLTPDRNGKIVFQTPEAGTLATVGAAISVGVGVYTGGGF
jgi:metallophosphoesterase (TIGR03767 family)